MLKKSMNIYQMNYFEDHKREILAGMDGDGISKIYDIIVKDYGKDIVLSPEELKSPNNPNRLHIINLIVDRLKSQFKEESIRQVISLIFGHLDKMAKQSSASKYRRLIALVVKNKGLDKINKK